MSFRNADVLYAAGGDIWEKYGTFVWRTLPGEEPSHDFSRSGTAWFLDRNQRYRKAEDGLIRPEWIDRQSQYGVRLERAATPVSDDSVRFDASATAWTEKDVASTAAKPSIFDDLPTDGEARQVVGNGTANNAGIRQTLGSSTGAKEASIAIFEDDGSTTEVVVDTRDGSGVIAVTRYDFDTDSITGTGGDANYVKVLSDSGPNGGRVVAVVAIGTGNNTSGRETRVETDRDSAGNGAIVHYAHHVELAFPTSPIPYVGAPQSRPAEDFHTEFGGVGTGVGPCLYMDLILEKHTWTEDPFTYLVEITDSARSNPKMSILVDGNDAVEMRYVDGGANTSEARPVGNGALGSFGQVPGDRLELFFAVDPSNGDVRGAVRPGGGSANGASGSGAAGYDGVTAGRFTLNSRADLNDRSAAKYLRAYMVDQAALDNSPLSAGADSVMDELAGHTV